MKRIAIFFAALVLLSGCSTLKYLTVDLKPANPELYILVENETTYVTKRGMGTTWKEGVQKGVYRAELENEHGTYFRGPPGCVIQFQEHLSMGPFDGGIWVPKDRTNKVPLIYYYFNFNQKTALDGGGVVVTGILSAYKGDITFIPPTTEKTFLSDVVVTNIPLK